MKKLFTILALSALAHVAQAQTQAVIETNLGNIELSLDEQKAPKTVANFVQYAKKGFYNNTIFHRVIDNFMVQGGGFTTNMLQKPTDEAITNEADNGLKNDVGTIAMARTGQVHSATSQFFINLKNNDFLNHTSKTDEGYGYAVFGQVVNGMDIVQKMAKVRTTRKLMHADVPVEPIIIKKISIVEPKAEPTSKAPAKKK